MAGEVLEKQSAVVRSVGGICLTPHTLLALSNRHRWIRARRSLCSGNMKSYNERCANSWGYRPSACNDSSETRAQHTSIDKNSCEMICSAITFSFFYVNDIQAYRDHMAVFRARWISTLIHSLHRLCQRKWWSNHFRNHYTRCTIHRPEIRCDGSNRFFTISPSWSPTFLMLHVKAIVFTTSLHTTFTWAFDYTVKKKRIMLIIASLLT